MLTSKEESFVQDWEHERLGRSSFTNKIVSGLPMAMLFGLPVLVLLFVVQFYMPQWFTKVSQATQKTQDGQGIVTTEFTDNPEWYNRSTQFSSGLFITIIVAVLLCVFFFSYFRMSYKWEMNEQLYRELKQKQNRVAVAPQ